MRYEKPHSWGGFHVAGRWNALPRGDQSPSLREIRPLKRAGRENHSSATSRTEIRATTVNVARVLTRGESSTSEAVPLGSADVPAHASPKSPFIPRIPWRISKRTASRKEGQPVTAAEDEPRGCQRNRAGEASRGQPTCSRLKPTLPKQLERSSLKEAFGGTGHTAPSSPQHRKLKFALRRSR